MPKEEEKETRDQKRIRQTQEIHAALGRYVEAFELLVHQIRGMCVLLLSRTPKHMRLVNVVFHYKTMTAEPLFKIYRGLVGELLNDKDAKIPDEERVAILGVLQTFDTDYQDAMSTRNDYLHGTWFIGYGNAQTEDFSKISFSKFKVKNEGLAQVMGPSSAQEIEPLTTECNRLRDYFMRFHACFTWHPSPRVARNFMRDPANKRWIVIPPKT